MAIPADNEGGWGTTSIESSEARPDQSPKTNKDGKARFIIPAGQEFEVLALGRLSAGRVRVPALEQGERLLVTLEIPTEADIHQFVRVVSEAGQTPIPGARVQVLHSPSFYFGEDKGDSRPYLLSDSNGLVEVWARSWEAPLGEVSADGYGVQLFALEEGHETPDRALPLPLRESADLGGSILGPSGNPESGITVDLTADGFHLRTPRSGQQLILSGPWWGQHDRNWKEETRGDGRFEFVGLPAWVPLELEIRRGNETLRKGSEPLRLEPGENREVVWRVGGGATLRGLVVDQDDDPISYQDMWLTAGHVPHYFDPYGRGVVATARSDAKGRFSFDDVSPGEWLVGPEAVRKTTLRSAPAPLPSHVTVLEGVLEQEVLVRVECGLYVRGRVLDPDGNPIANAYVHGRSDLGSLMRATEHGGKFAIGPLMPGPITLWANSMDCAPTETIETEAGDRDVVLHLRAGVSLSGLVVEKATGAPQQAEVWATARGIRPFGRQLGQAKFVFGNDGNFEFKGLIAGTHDLVARTKDGQIGLLLGITLGPGEVARGLEVVVEEGAKLRVRREGGAGGFFYVIHEGAVVLMDGIPREGIVGTVPSGTLKVRLVDPEIQEEVEEILTLGPGETGEVTFGDK